MRRHAAGLVSVCSLLLPLGCSSLPDELGQGRLYIDTQDELVRSSLRELFTQLDWEMELRSDNLSPPMRDPVHDRLSVRRYDFQGETGNGDGVMVVVSHEEDRPAEVYIAVAGNSRASRAARGKFLRIASQYAGSHAVRLTQPADSL